MKKLVILALLLGFAANAHAACQGPYCYDDNGATIKNSVTLEGGFLRLPVYTAAQINGLAGPTTGQAMIECFNCTIGPGICKSTGSANGSWVILASTGGIMNVTHCQ